MSGIVRFGSYEVDLSAGQLRKHGVRIGLRDQSFQVLASLLEHAGEVVTRESLQRRLWHSDAFVDFENSLNTAVARLREALCDSSDHPRFIETLPRRGYRFVARVSEAPALSQPIPAPRARLVVLPFMNLSGNAAQEYFADAMTDDIITVLASLAPEHLAVIARTTAMHYKGNHKDVGRIGRELGVDYVVEGGIRREEHVAINVQLIQVTDQAHLFARKYEAELRDISDVQRSIAQAIAAHIPSVADKVRGAQIARKPTEDVAAYTEYIKGGCEMWKWTPLSVAKAKQHFEAAVARDSRFALALRWHRQPLLVPGFLGICPAR
jgi:TolB-like protein